MTAVLCAEIVVSIRPTPSAWWRAIIAAPDPLADTLPLRFARDGGQMPVDAVVRSRLDDEESDDGPSDGGLQHLLAVIDHRSVQPVAITIVTGALVESPVQHVAARGEGRRGDGPECSTVVLGRGVDDDLLVRGPVDAKRFEHRGVDHLDEAEPELLKQHRLAQPETVEPAGHESHSLVVQP